MRTRLTMTRCGRFTATLSSTKNGCGTELAFPGAKTYKYECEVRVGSKLDAQGFVLDNEEVRKYFTKTFGDKPIPAMSCEEIALVALKDLKEMFLKHECMVYRIRVTIHGSKNSSLQAEWLKT